MTDSTYHLWLEELTFAGWDSDTLLIAAPDSKRSWVADRYARVLQTSAAAALGPEVTIQIVARRVVADPTTLPPRPHREPLLLAETFNPKYTFEQFIIGDGNRLAHAAALAVAEMPGQAYNPLFIYGPPGLGKTHLLHAIANYLAVHEPQTTVRYVASETFTNQFVHAIHNRGADEFKALYRDTDVLLIDDVQFFERKAKTEEEVFHTFNALHATGAQLVLTSDRRPHDLEAIEDRLRERFGSGLVTDVEPPDLAMRVTVLRKRAGHDGVELADPRALEAIAERLTGSIRDLESALIRVVAFHSLTREPITPALVDKVLHVLYPASRPPRRTVAQIQDATAAAFRITVEELRSKARAPRVAWPRQVAMYLCRECTGESFPAIGRAFARDHSTVQHACRKTTQRMAADPVAHAAVQRVREHLGEIRQP